MTDVTQMIRTAADMVASGKGILAADESIATMSARLEKAGIAPTEENRRAYREMLVTTPGLAGTISGVILCDETFGQSLADGRPFPQAITRLGMLPGIKVDTGAKPLAGAPGETVTEGLDGLRERLRGYAGRGARFAKWRAVIAVGAGRPTPRACQANAHALARYAALCQEAGIVPIVEPEVLMNGRHGAAACAAATAVTVSRVFAELREAGVQLRAAVLKPNMVVPGADSGEVRTPQQVARDTIETLRPVVPDDIPGIAFLSGGQGTREATANLAAMHRLEAPWPLTFSFGRALVDPALAAWRGQPRQAADGQRALAHRVRCNAAALAGTYDEELETERAA